MSLVGPRPTVQQRVDEYPEYQRKRLSMRPGMTGLAQTRGNVLLSWPRRIQYDCEYVERFTVFLDLQILINTVGVILLGEEKYISGAAKLRGAVAAVVQMYSLMSSRADYFTTTWRTWNKFTIEILSAVVM